MEGFMCRLFLTGFLTLFIVTFSFASYSEDSLEWDAEYYVNNSSLQFQWAHEKIAKLNLKGNERIIEIGCGNGKFAEALAYHLPDGGVLGVDPSTTMLDIANKRLEASNAKNLSFVAGVGQLLGYEEQFDLAVSFSVLHWISDNFSVLESIEKALVPGGRTFLFFAPEYGKDRFDHAIDYVAEKGEWKGYFKNFTSGFHLVTPTQFVNYIEKAGLLLTRIEVVTVDDVFDSKELFMQWITAWLQHLRFLPKEKHEQFMLEIIDRYLEKHPVDEKGKIHFYDYWMEVEAQKPL